MIIRAYHDPALRRPISRDGSWGSALELPCGPNGRREKRVYVHNPSAANIITGLQIPTVSGFGIIAPSSVNLAPGVTSFLIAAEASGTYSGPLAMDFTINGVVEEDSLSPGGAFSDSSFTDSDEGTYSGSNISASTLRLEVTTFMLPTGDERFQPGGLGPLRSTASLATYVASGMGFVDDDYKAGVVDFVTEHTYDTTLWALNKHYLFNANYSPMRLSRNRAEAIGYNPPGVPAMPPIIRRRVYSRAYELARATGSAAGILGIFQAIGVPLTQVGVEREGFTWYVSVPQWVAAVFNADLLGNLALYHVDPYCNVALSVNEETTVGYYSDLDYAVEPSPAYAGGSLLLEHSAGQTVVYGGSTVTYGGSEVTYGELAYLLLEDGTKLLLEG